MNANRRISRGAGSSRRPSRAWRARRAAGLLVGLLLGGPFLGSGAQAHEFWVEPERYATAPGEPIVAALKVGRGMSGLDFPYLRHRFHAFSVSTRSGSRDAPGVDGDSPALRYVPRGAGLHVIAYHSVADLAHYDAWDEFVRYLDKEGLAGIAEAHRARGLPEADFDESYTRYAKGLVQVGPAEPDDLDRAIGLALELVAAANPYAGTHDALTVTLLWQGAPLAGAQVTVFERDGDVERRTVTTDAAGRAEISLAPGAEYLLNAVHMTPAEDGAAWRSHWASLTFRVGAGEP